MEYPTLDPKRIGERILELRNKRNIKVREISEYMGFGSDQAIYKWQRGESLPTVDNLYALSRLFNTTVDYILQGEREEDDMSSPFFNMFNFQNPPNLNHQCMF